MNKLKKMFSKKELKQNKWLVGLLLSLVVTGLIIMLYSFNVGEPFELKTIDLRFKLRGQTQANKAVGIITMGDESIEALGKWPWHRSYHGLMIHILSQYKPAAICFDVLFTEENPDFPKDDIFLAQSSMKSKVTYFPFYFDISDIIDKASYSLLKRIVSIDNTIKKASIPLPYEYRNAEKNYRAVLITPPIKQLTEASRGSGFVNILPDIDGSRRRVPLVIEYKGKLYLSFAFNIACDYIGVDKKDIFINPGKFIEIKKSKIGPVKIPIDSKGRMLINYSGGLEAFKLYPYAQILFDYKQISEGLKPSFIDFNDIKDKILFIGLTATGTSDLGATPFSPVYPLVGVLASTASNVINKDFLAETGNFANILIILILGLLIGLVTPKMKPVTGALFSIIMIAAYFGLTYYLFACQRLCLKVIYPCIAILFTYLTIVVYKFAVEEKEKKWIKNIFQRYVSSQVVDELLSDVDKLNLGGTKKELTIFFADIRGFTSMSEKMKPEEIVGVLNRIFTMITEILFKYEGTLDKFIGDCVMAIWGAPIALKNPEELAVRTAMEMQEKMKTIQQELINEGKLPVGFGIGINTGEVVVGNIGSVQRMDYTVIGDEVNLASRVQGCAKSGQVLITESTYNKIKDKIKVNKLEPVKVKGKTNLIQIYEVISME